ncbi:hypothetical protein [Nocardioides bruguierae]|uniref:Uncharacterized protein n=1 Tax=Nocardioides bruguierae TaxID=2945102 RepID=A0A9X2ID07_9ACTN|nr:hypothetical protein [Nocardioides bruguierae]MCM0618772.1 hypothetical protein [Nocardioides bruguierae]
MADDQAPETGKSTTSTTSTARRAKPSRRVGDHVQLKPGGIVIRPGGVTHILVRGGFVLDEPGTFTIDGEPVEVA